LSMTWTIILSLLLTVWRSIIYLPWELAYSYKVFKRMTVDGEEYRPIWKKYIFVLTTAWGRYIPALAKRTRGEKICKLWMMEKEFKTSLDAERGLVEYLEDSGYDCSVLSDIKGVEK